MKRIVVLAGSNSKQSINKKLAVYTAGLLSNVELVVLDLNDYQMPIYSIDIEQESGIDKEAIRFNTELQNADAYIVSLAEHNGSYAAVFKNAYDWASRVNYKVWGEKPVLLMATSPGARGGSSVLETAKNGFPHLGANVVGSFSLPSFGQNFVDGKIVDTDLQSKLSSVVKKLAEAL